MKELYEQLEDLEQKYFILNMQDHWDSTDYRYADKLKQQIREVKEKITNEQKRKKKL